MASAYPSGLDEDLAVYSFDALHETDFAHGAESDLAHLLNDEGLNDLNDETFGAQDDAFGDHAPPVGRDFDFAGSTNRFLGTDAAADAGLKQQQQQQGRPLQPLSNDWSDPLLSASTPAGRSLSPWTGLDDDPLLGRGSGAALPVSLPPPQQPSQPQRQVKTLDEVEAEMRAAAAQRQQQQQQQPQPQGRQMTVEEVEAEMLRKKQQQAAAPPLQPQLPPGMSPQPQAALPPGFPPQGFPPGFFPPQGFPPLPPQIQALPPHLQAQFIAQMQAQGRLPPGPFPPPQGFLPGHPGAAGGPASRPASLGGAPFPPQSPAPGAAQPPQGPPMQIPLPSQSPAFIRPPPGPGTPGPAFPPLGAPAPGPLPAGQQQQQQPGGANLLATLFPPLPSQAPPGSVASVEQGLHFLSLHQHAQHPSLTGAQLQALLQQAQAVSVSAGATAGEGEQGVDGAAQGAEDKKRVGEELIRKVEARIMEHEAAELKRKKKAMKIASMAKHNNLMSNSDKDFITRIQVSQLVTDDPYADDFYFHIMAAIKASRMNAALAASGLPPPGAPGGPGGPPLPGANGPGASGPNGPNNANSRRQQNRRETAMNRMAQNVQRLVDSAKKRNANAPTTLSLDGALGKIATRTRSAPRPLLQVKPSSASVTTASSAAAADKDKAQGGDEAGQQKAGAGVSTGQSLLTGAGLITASSEAASAASAPAQVTGPLSHRDALVIVEKIYDCVLDLEQLRRIQPQLQGTVADIQARLEQMVDGEVKEQVRGKLAEAQLAVQEGDEKYRELVSRLWDNLHVMDPLDACTPHPFISLLSVLKGKRILPRAIRHLSPEQTLTLLTLLVATFDTLDVVVDAPVLDQLDTATSADGRQRRVAVEAKTEALLNSIVAPVMQVVQGAQLRMVTGMLGLLMDRNDLLRVVRSKPGLAFLTILLSRAEQIKQQQPAPEAADLQQWHQTFTHLFSVLAANLLALYPSTRLAASLPFGVAQYQSLDALRPEADADDEPVWRFLAAVAVCADPDQQQLLVTGVRDKVIENVRASRQGAKAKGAQAIAPEKAAMKIRNVNLLLHALSLDASMIETDDE
ncbi:uncharacterized protein JCM10292_003590 [Rhodotorula paludigena]|uniref:uncharacterized protein n=1 Tax=Rhodotorula paludigena TaxID=86838 RepID=UPI00317D4AC7